MVTTADDKMLTKAKRWQAKRITTFLLHDWLFPCYIFKISPQIPFQRSWPQRTWSSRRGSSISPASLSHLKSPLLPETTTELPLLRCKKPKTERWLGEGVCVQQKKSVSQSNKSLEMKLPDATLTSSKDSLFMLCSSCLSFSCWRNINQKLKL